MQAIFGINREKNNKLFYHEYENSRGGFHFHSQIELCFVDEGELDVVVNGHRKRLKKGEMSVALSFDSHSYHTADNSKTAFLFVPIYLCEEFVTFAKDKRITNPFICEQEVVDKIRSCVKELIKVNENEFKVKGYIYVILGTIIEHLMFESKQIASDTNLSTKLLFYINENFKREMTLSDIAMEMGYNPAYISRYFKDTFKIGISQYITMIRLRNALMLMRENRHNITYCAMESGFASMRTFYRAFQNEFQCSPREHLIANKSV